MIQSCEDGHTVPMSLSSEEGTNAPAFSRQQEPLVTIDTVSIQIPRPKKHGFAPRSTSEASPPSSSESESRSETHLTPDASLHSMRRPHAVLGTGSEDAATNETVAQLLGRTAKPESRMLSREELASILDKSIALDAEQLFRLGQAFCSHWQIHSEPHMLLGATMAFQQACAKLRERDTNSELTTEESQVFFLYPDIVNILYENCLLPEVFDQAVEAGRQLWEFVSSAAYKESVTPQKLRRDQATTLDVLATTHGTKYEIPARTGVPSEDPIADAEDLYKAVVLVTAAEKLLQRTDEARPFIAGNLANDLDSRFMLLGRLTDLNRAISLTRDACQSPATSSDPITRRQAAVNLAVKLMMRFNNTESSKEDLQEALDLMIRVVEGTPEGDPEYVARSEKLLAIMSAKAAFLNIAFSLEDYNTAVALGKEILARLPTVPGARRRVATDLRGLALAMFRRQLREEGKTDKHWLEEALVWDQEVSPLSNEGHALGGAFESLTDTAVDRLLRIPINEASMGGQLHHQQRDLTERERDLERLEEQIRKAPSQEVALTVVSEWLQRTDGHGMEGPSDSSNNSQRLVADSEEAKFQTAMIEVQRSPQFNDFVSLLTLGRKPDKKPMFHAALREASEQYARLIDALPVQAAVWLGLFRAGVLEWSLKFDAATEQLGDYPLGLWVTPFGLSNELHLTLFNTASDAMRDAYDETQNLDLLGVMVKYDVHELQLAGSDIALQLPSLERTAWVSCYRSGLTDLERAIRLAERVVELTSSRGPTSDLHNKAVLTLAHGLSARYAKFHISESLDRAIAVLGQAVLRTSSRCSGGYRSKFLVKLAFYQGMRYGEQRNELDILTGLYLCRLAHASQGVLPRQLESELLAVTTNLMHRFFLDKQDLNMLNGAITLIRKTLPTVDEGSAEWFVMAHTLSSLLRLRAQPPQNEDEIERLKASMELAREVFSGDDRSLAVVNEMVGRLISALQGTGIQEQDMEVRAAIRQSVEINRKLLLKTKEVPEDSRSSTRVWAAAFGLYFCLRSLCELDAADRDAVKDRAELLEVAREMYQLRKSSDLEGQVHSAQECARVLLEAEQMDEAYDCLLAGLDALLERPLWLPLHDLESLIRSGSFIQNEVACAALRLQKPALDTVRNLEKARGIVLGLTVDLRSDLSLMEGVDAEVIEEVQQIRKRLEKTSVLDMARLPGVSPFFDAAAFGSETGELLALGVRHGLLPVPESELYDLRQRERDMARLQEILGSRGGETSAGKPEDESQEKLLSMASRGSVAFLVNSEILNKTLAILIQGSGIRSQELPEMTNSEIRRHLVLMDDCKRPGDFRYFASKGKLMGEVLVWLWKVAVKPVLDNLYPEQLYSPGAKESLPRVWWIGAGFLSRFPFHAAGDFSTSPAQCAMDRVISSYTPSLKVLSFARQRESRSVNIEKARVLALTMEAAVENKPKLPDVKAEAQAIRSLLPSPEQMTILDRPTALDAAAAIPKNDIVHFACHGVAIMKHPAQSHLALAKTNPNGEEIMDPLYVKDVLQTNTETGGGGITFLSACHTADTDPNLSDEAIHMAAAFQMAGFSHVVGTMWNTRNTACRGITKLFYRNLLQNGARGSGGGGQLDVARALHDAVKEFRESGRRNPLLWASFSHWGA